MNWLATWPSPTLQGVGTLAKNAGRGKTWMQSVGCSPAKLKNRWISASIQFVLLSAIQGEAVTAVTSTPVTQNSAHHRG